MKKVLIISPDINSQGGISSVVKMYHDNHLYNDEVIYLASYKKLNIFFQLIFYSVFMLKYIFTLLKGGIKIVHIHTASKGSFLRKFAVLHLAKLFGKKVIMHIHGAKFDEFYAGAGSLKQIITATLNKADLVLVLSKEWKEKISSISSNENIEILYNPAVIKEQAESGEGAIFMGRLGQRKGVYDIIEAAKCLTSNTIINLYGDGSLKLPPLPDNIKIHGWVSGEKKDEVFKNAAMLILPSYNEGLPVSILEAMAYGLPVIATPVGGIPEAVKDSVNGFLIEAGDYKALAQKIDLLTNDKTLREKMGTESYKMAKEKFDVKIILKKLGRKYDDLLRE